MIERHKQFTPLVTVTSTFDILGEPDHSHNYYEIIYIKSGKGKHHLNGEILDFGPESLFLIDPYDIHHFEADEHSVFVVIKFTESYISENRNISAKWQREFKYLLSSNSMFVFEGENASVIKKIFELVIACQNDENIVFFQLLSIMEVIKKEVSSQKEIALHPKVASDGKIERVLSYIHENIKTPQLLTIEAIAAQFGISHHYVSTYFKRNMELTLRQYIDNYRMALLQKRLINSDFTVKEIAYDFGFTDESHLNKIFKRYWGMSAKVYRESNIS